MVSFKEARAFLLQHRTDYDAAVKGFCWPDPVPFNWALDWFDAELARNPDSRDRAALSRLSGLVASSASNQSSAQLNGTGSGQQNPFTAAS